MPLPPALQQLLAPVRQASGRILVLTGAGISAESSVPTFRGPEGYWQVGSTNYRAEDLATNAAFTRMPAEVWGWYLHRRGVCLSAQPNTGHAALVAIERAHPQRFLLVTQNVDGLHLRAGNSRVLQIHGNLDFARCAIDCSPPQPLPSDLGRDWPKDRALDPATTAQLRCRGCGGWLRPHVLWFDECYDEEHYHFDSALAGLDDADLLLVVGTSGATNLPNILVKAAFTRRLPLVVLNAEPSPFSKLAQKSPAGFFAQGSAGDWLPRIAAALGAEAASTTA